LFYRVFTDGHAEIYKAGRSLTAGPDVLLTVAPNASPDWKALKTALDVRGYKINLLAPDIRAKLTS
jgi:hypothetical protein